MDKLVSVIIPVYNVEKYIEPCIISIMKQSYKNLEIILVDDGSTDGSFQVCRNYEKQDKRIKLLHKENGGLSDARNKGIALSTGRYLCFVDGDDTINVNFISALVNNIEQAKADISIARIIQKNKGNYSELYKNEFKDGLIMGRKEAMGYLSLESKLSTCACNKLYNADLFQELRFPHGKIYEDKFIMHRLFEKCNTFVIANKAEYYYGIRSESITAMNFQMAMLDNIEASLDRLIFYMRYYPEYTSNIKANLCSNAIWIYIKAVKGAAKDPVKKSLQLTAKDYLKYYIFQKEYPISQRLWTVTVFTLYYLHILPRKIYKNEKR